MYSIRKLAARKEYGISTEVIMNIDSLMAFSSNQKDINCISVIKKFPLWSLTDLIMVNLYNENGTSFRFISLWIKEIFKKSLLVKYIIDKNLYQMANLKSLFINAIHKEDINIVKMLIAYGINLNSVGLDAIVSSAASSQYKIFKLLLKQVDYNPVLRDIIKYIIYTHSTKMLKIALRYNVFNRYSLNGYPLNLAMENNNTSMIKILLNYNAQVT